MNDLPIEQAQDPDLRSTRVALRRAAQRARDLAQQTGTALVVRRNGVLEHVMPTPSSDDEGLGAQTARVEVAR